MTRKFLPLPQSTYSFLHIIVHNNEIYSNVVRYMRASGIVPPSTAARGGTLNDIHVVADIRARRPAGLRTTTRTASEKARGTVPNSAGGILKRTRSTTAAIGLCQRGYPGRSPIYCRLTWASRRSKNTAKRWDALIDVTARLSGISIWIGITRRPGC